MTSYPTIFWNMLQILYIEETDKLVQPCIGNVDKGKMKKKKLHGQISMNVQSLNKEISYNAILGALNTPIYRLNFEEWEYCNKHVSNLFDKVTP